MKIFQPLERLEKKYAIDEKNYSFKGSCGKIYSVGNNSLVKVPFDFHRSFLLSDKTSQWRLYDESKTQELAVELGVKFPKVEGIYAIKDHNSGIYYPGLSMADLGNMTLNKLSGSVLKEAERQRNVEIDKARDLGFKIRDTHILNCIWFQEQTFLLDAGLCEFVA